MAAGITDRILTNVPLRQWVLSRSHKLRGLAAKKPDVLIALDWFRPPEVLPQFVDQDAGR
ncbi:hypothetical protein [Sorangium sp. So ce388]|uniref:hypothetical protein n=1 Tax=Sorangium sp. So ce388 TaxID=3133309 RepID=UPI003F5B3ED7